MPHLAGRAVTLARFPDGVDGPGWYQSNCPQGAARTATVTGPSGKTVRYCLIEDEEALVWAANLGAIELHPFLARADAPDRPAALVFDSDPGPLHHRALVAARHARAAGLHAAALGRAD